MRVERWSGRFFPYLLLGVYCCCLWACSSRQLTPKISDLPPLNGGEILLSPGRVLQGTPALQPLLLDRQIKTIVDRYIDRRANPSVKVRQITRLIMDEAFIGLDYAPAFTGTAIEVAQTGRGNCLGFSHLFIAIARHVGLDANYQRLQVKPGWNKRGPWLLVEYHVNAHGALGRDQVYTADIDRSMRYRQLRGELLSDEAGLALHYNNLAMEKLLDGQIRQAWSLLLQAVVEAPQLPELWTNLGTVYKHNAQLEDARWSYQQALQRDPQSVVALQHLQRIHQQLGDRQLASRYAARLEKYRASNPYYQAWLAAAAAEQLDWRAASEAISRAIELKPGEFDFHVAAAQYLWRQGESGAAQQRLARARQLAQGPQKARLNHLELQLAELPRELATPH